MNRTFFSLASLTLVVVSGCFSTTAVDDPDKEAARATNGLGAGGVDLCLAHGWYQDGVCDDFCPELDPECVRCPNPDPSRRVRYLFDDPDDCDRADLACDPDETTFQNECGCGCIGPASPPCPDPDDPHVRYLSADPDTCALADLACEPGESAFSNACGCGCIGEPTACPDPSDPRVAYASESPEECARLDLACAPDATIFSNECGCGCIAPEPTCPDPDDPAVHYIAESPMACAVIDFGCLEGQTGFDGPCGCGCIDDEPTTCAGKSEYDCRVDPLCSPGYAGFCDCTCPGPGGYEGGACTGCGPECFSYQACVPAETTPSCPDESHPYIRYISRVDAECAALPEPLQWNCGDEEAFFSTPACGCGCIGGPPL